METAGIITILYFFVVVYALGYSVTCWVRRADNPLERHIMTFAYGLAALPVLIILLNTLRIWLWWPVILALSLVVPAIRLVQGVRSGRLTRWLAEETTFTPRLRLSKESGSILVALSLSLVVFAVMHQGAFSYPYLEDDDPWEHAIATRYVQLTMSYSVDPAARQTYLEPYPPAFAAMNGILYQLGPELVWQLKFVNLVLVALAHLFFYFFARSLTGSRRYALFAAFALAVIPCFLSHFIWATSLAVCLFFPAFYALERARDKDADATRGWWLVAALTIAAVWVTQGSNAFILGFLIIIYYLVTAIVGRSIERKVLYAGILGLAVGLGIFWVPSVAKFGFETVKEGNSIGGKSFLHLAQEEAGGGLLYSWDDFIYAQPSSKMDNPTGVGSALFWLAAFSIALATIWGIVGWKRIPERRWMVIAILWTFFAFAGIHSNRLPVQLMPHRFWAILAIPLSLLAGVGFFFILDSVRTMPVPKQAKGLAAFCIGAIVVLGILGTSGYFKYKVQTSTWPPGVAWASYEEIPGYVWLESLPRDTTVLSLCSHGSHAIAYDKLSYPWVPEIKQFTRTSLDGNASSILAFLKRWQYEYAILDAGCVVRFGANRTNEMLQDMLASGSFVPVYPTAEGQPMATIVFRVT
ncbi:hypothetical protein JXB02_01860 [Candidatus Woesearchaeota archaeon]|nr:hypothetical protein [Candidatus Woesearchaeota archaeon]